jgi:hypothetical protein
LTLKNSKILQATSYLKKDEHNLVVEEYVSIKPISTDGTNRRQIYRINMYKTAFTIEANGRESFSVLLWLYLTCNLLTLNAHNEVFLE